ncbi:Type IV secretion system protein virB1 (plasmid) [Burkholderia sp. AD24]|nr:Type IV secretion system protein virB1 [Burkholderia sp. AD24]
MKTPLPANERGARRRRADYGEHARVWPRRGLAALLAGVLIAAQGVGPFYRTAHAAVQTLALADSDASFTTLARECAPNVDRDTLAALVRTESGFNPYAIGVVGGHLLHQPATLAVALATARELDARGFSFSVGLTQVNNRNFGRAGETLESIFEPCRNLRAGAAVLTECFARSRDAIGDAQQALRAALSCYYSGNFTTGFKKGYVSRVVSNAWRSAQEGGVEAIPVVRDQPPLSPRLSGGRRHTDRDAPPGCRARAPITMTCRGLSIEQARAMCVRCLDAR